MVIQIVVSQASAPRAVFAWWGGPTRERRGWGPARNQIMP